jgi:hypothetical protein
VPDMAEQWSLRGMSPVAVVVAESTPGRVTRTWLKIVDKQ